MEPPHEDNHDNQGDVFGDIVIKEENGEQDITSSLLMSINDISPPSLTLSPSSLIRVPLSVPHLILTPRNIKDLEVDNGILESVTKFETNGSERSKSIGKGVVKSIINDRFPNIRLIKCNEYIDLSTGSTSATSADAILHFHEINLYPKKTSLTRKLGPPLQRKHTGVSVKKYIRRTPKKSPEKKEKIRQRLRLRPFPEFNEPQGNTNIRRKEKKIPTVKAKGANKENQECEFSEEIKLSKGASHIRRISEKELMKSLTSTSRVKNEGKNLSSSWNWNFINDKRAFIQLLDCQLYINLTGIISASEAAGKMFEKEREMKDSWTKEKDENKGELERLERKRKSKSPSDFVFLAPSSPLSSSPQEKRNKAMQQAESVSITNVNPIPSWRQRFQMSPEKKQELRRKAKALWLAEKSLNVPVVKDDDNSVTIDVTAVTTEKKDELLQNEHSLSKMTSKQPGRSSRIEELAVAAIRPDLDSESIEFSMKMGHSAPVNNNNSSAYLSAEDGNSRVQSINSSTKHPVQDEGITVNNANLTSASLYLSAEEGDSRVHSNNSSPAKFPEDEGINHNETSITASE